MKRISILLAAVVMAAFCFTGCGSSSEEEVTLNVFAAKSLNGVMEELYTAYQEEHPEVTFTANYESSGTLMEQIEEGASCDVFFSADRKQIDELDGKGMLESDTITDIVNNQVCVVAAAGSDTKVTGLDDMGNASSLAIADGSVPVGKYTREAMINAGILEETDDPASVTTEEISEALGGVTINECANVGAVTTAVAEGSNEAGTIYYSDLYGMEDKIDIVEILPYDLTGDVIYPAAVVADDERSDAAEAAAQDFVTWLRSDKALEIFEKYHFDTELD